MPSSLHLLLAAAVLRSAAGRQHERPLQGSIIFGSRRTLMTCFGSPRFFSTDKYTPAVPVSSSGRNADKPGVMLKLPNFDILFDDIAKVSPLAKQALTDHKPLGIKAIDPADDVYKWKLLGDSASRLVSHVDKIDNYNNKGLPLVRLRSTLHGPIKKRAECFSELISVPNLRHKWDPTSDLVDTVYSADVKEIDIFQNYTYGETSLFGVGYVKTKQSVVSPREQLVLCGLQVFPSGASVLWGIELEEDQNHLFPVEQPKRQPRSTSHLFATTIIPTGDYTFDVEYLLQIEIGGFPGWLTGPIVVETVKKMFRFANGYFKGGLDGTGDLAKRLALIPDEDMHDWDRPLIDPLETTKSIEALSPLESLENQEQLNPMGSLEDLNESLKDEVEIDDDDDDDNNDAPPPVKKRRGFRSRLRRLVKRNKLESNEGTDYDDDAPSPVKKRRRDVIRSRLGLGKRNKLASNEGADNLDQKKTLLKPS